MMKTTTLLLGTAAAPLLIAAALTPERIAFAPAEGTSLAKTFTLTTNLSLDDMDMQMNGQPSPMPMEMEIEGSNVTTVSVNDEYTAIAGSRPSELHRTYETISMTGDSSTSNPMTGEQEISMTGTSELTGLTVAFAWDEDEGDYTARFLEEDAGDEELLEELAEDMDLRGLLPEGEVAMDESWEIDPQALEQILSPGGNLQLDMETEGAPAGMDSAGSGMDGNYGEMLGEIDGSMTGTLTGVREVDGRQVAQIAIKIETESSNDMTELVREQIENAELPPEAGEMEIEVESVDVELEVEGEGTLLWDIEGGHFHSLECTLEIISSMDNAMAMAGPMGDMLIEQTMDFTASLTVSATAERL